MIFNLNKQPLAKSLIFENLGFSEMILLHYYILPILSSLKVLQKLEVKSLSQEQIESANDKAKLSQEELDFVLKVRSKDLGSV